VGFCRVKDSIEPEALRAENEGEGKGVWVDRWIEGEGKGVRDKVRGYGWIDG